MQRKLQALTAGTLLGAGIGALDTVPLLHAIRSGSVSVDIGSVLLVPVGFAFLGCLLGIVGEYAIQHSGDRNNHWFRHFVRPVVFCTLPYLVVALSFWCFGDNRLIGGFGFWICVVIIPILGFQIAWRRSINRE